MSEMVTVLLTRLQGEKKITREVATALLTGIVAKTDRFMGDKTTPSTMNVAQKLMMAGANPILIAESMKGEGILNENDGLGFMEGEIPERKTPKGGSGSLDAVSASGGSDVSGATMASGAGQVSVGLDAAGGGSLQKVVTPEEGAQARVAAEEASRAVASANGVSEAAEVQVHNGRDSEEGGLHRLDKIAEEIVNEKREERVQTEAEDGEQADEKGDPGEVLGEGAVKAGDKIRKARIYPGDEGGEVMVPDMFSGKDYEAMMENELGDGAASSGGATEGASSEVSSGAVAEVASPETQDLQTNSPTMDAVGTMGGVENLAAVAAPEVASAPETNHIPEMNYAPQAGGQIEAGQVGDQAAVVQAGAEQVNNASQAGAEQAGLNQEAGGVVNFRAEEMTPISAPQRVAQPMSDSEVVQPWQMEVPEVKMEIPEAEVSEVSAEAVGTEVAQGEPSAEIPVEAVAAEVPEGSYSPVDGLPIPNGGVEETVSAEQVMPEQAAPEQGQDDPGAFRIPGM